MGLPALTAVGASLFTKLEGLASSKAAKASSTPAPQQVSTSDASTVSNPGMLFSQLQNLSQQNPTEFKKITAQVAQQLQAASGSTSASSPQSSVLNQMASNFQHASQTGSFSDLFSHASQSASQQASTAAAAHPHQQYAQSNGAADANTVSGIFSQALSQIKVDLGTNAALSSASV